MLPFYEIQCSTQTRKVLGVPYTPTRHRQNINALGNQLFVRDVTTQPASVHDLNPPLQLNIDDEIPTIVSRWLARYVIRQLRLEYKVLYECLELYIQALISSTNNYFNTPAHYQ